MYANANSDNYKSKVQKYRRSDFITSFSFALCHLYTYLNVIWTAGSCSQGPYGWLNFLYVIARLE